MAANTTPRFADTPFCDMATISTANTNRDGTGTIGTIHTAGTNGSLINRIIVEATGTTTAGIVRLFIYTGSSYFLWKEVLVSATTPSGTVAAFTSELDSTDFGTDFMLPSGYSIRASTHNAESFNIIVLGASY